jgi:hypothetical protein
MPEIQLDEYASPNFLSHHARIDQYQIYSLISDDIDSAGAVTTANEGIIYPIPDGFVRAIFLLNGQFTGAEFFGEAITRQASRKSRTQDSITENLGCSAFQSFDVYGKIPIDFAAIAQAFPVRKPALLTLNIPGSGIPDRAIAIEKEQASYKDLITGKPVDSINGQILDSRQLPIYYRGRATSSREIQYGYYRSNDRETHPNLKHSLDWLSGVIEVKLGQSYQLPINNPVLGTLMIDAQTAEEIINRPGDYPLNLVRYGANLQELVKGWNELYTPPIEASNRPWADAYTVTVSLAAFPEGFDPGTYWTHAFTTTGEAAPYNAITFKSETNYVPKTRILAANNDRWHYGTLTVSSNPPSENHPVFNTDDYSLFYTPNADGSIGSYIMDSPRLLEIHRALDAAKYASDPDDPNGGPRVVTLGWMIEKLTNFVGIRRKPNGKFLSSAEADKYKRTRLNNPKWTAGQYAFDEWGDRGLAIPYLPTAYKDGQRQDNQFDLVHDLPQLLQALHDQIDASQGIQHSAEIRLPIGQQVQAYPNQGAMLIDLAARMIEVQAMAERMMVMDVETSNTVRELFPGIGIPTATKSVSVEIGGKPKRIYYPAFQQGKGSILDQLGELAINIGIILGVLMPRGGKDERLNPFERKPKR